jgi:GNAT superfamily N-acetyltransferase
MKIRRVREGEGERLREIRLGALTDAPSAFDSSLSAERELPAEVWERRAAAGAAGVNAVTYFAEENGTDDARTDDTDGGPNDGGPNDGGPNDGAGENDGADDDNGGGAVVGLVTGLRDVGGAGDVLIVSMWVAPEARGHGLGRRLLDVVVDWAREVGAPYVELWVTEGNGPAQTLYERAGFLPTGVRAPLDTDPSLAGIKLRRVLDP